jgi:Transglycosylase SLT domain
MSSLDDVVNEASTAYGHDPSTLRAFLRFESGGDPRAVKGSHHGALQLTQSEFGKYSPGGDIYNLRDNVQAGAAKLADEKKKFAEKFGHTPEDPELYLVHNQGWGGAQAHINNPTGTAWQNMASTAEGRQKGPEWAKQAVWGNIPDDQKAQFPGGVDDVRSQDFMDVWKDKFQGQKFNTLLSDYRDHMQTLKAGAQAGAAGAPQDAGAQTTQGAVDPRLLSAAWSPYGRQPAAPQVPGQPSAPNYAQQPSASPQTMNYLNMMLAANRGTTS